MANSVAELVFSQPEQDTLDGIPATERRKLFARLWTRKEAYIKADGGGMSLQLKYIDVATLPNRILVLDRASGQWTTCQRWTLRTIEVQPPYVCCLAVEGVHWRLVRGDWSSNG
jgi:4'-phosphopantetheinyl transferase